MKILKNKEQLHNLFRLLDDESTKIQKILRHQILKNSLEIILNKNSYVQTLPYHERKRLEDRLDDLHNDIVLMAFKQLLNKGLEDIDLEKSCLVISYWEDPSISCEQITKKLDRMAETIAHQMPLSGHPLGFLDQMNQILLHRYGFRGNITDFYNPNNSFLHQVLETRMGIPLTLSVLYLLMSNRLNLPIYGISMPGHFILKFDNGEDEIFFDPFQDGKIYSRKECEEYLKQTARKNPEKVLKGCSNYEIVIRMLRNLHLVFSSYRNEPEKVAEIERYIRVITSHYAI